MGLPAIIIGNKKIKPKRRIISEAEQIKTLLREIINFASDIKFVAKELEQLDKEEFSKFAENRDYKQLIKKDYGHEERISKIAKWLISFGDQLEAIENKIEKKVMREPFETYENNRELYNKLIIKEIKKLTWLDKKLVTEVNTYKQVVNSEEKRMTLFSKFPNLKPLIKRKHGAILNQLGRMYKMLNDMLELKAYLTREKGDLCGYA